MGPLLSARVDEFGDAVCRLGGVFVFPDPHRLPTESSQPLIGISVPRSIGFDLLPPEISIALRPGSVLRAAVPKASVDEYGQSRARENDIGDAPRLSQHGNVEAIAQPLGM